MTLLHTMKLEDNQATLTRLLHRPDTPPLPAVKRQLLDYQLMALFILAQHFDRRAARILEIGTGQGGSAYMLAKAAPKASIVSLTTQPHEAEVAAAFWRRSGCENVEALVLASWDYLASCKRKFDLVFVDGDHNQIARDIPWFNRLREGGLFLCHDYSPQDSRSPSAIAYAELNAMAERLGRPFDVRLVDEGKVGMVGLYRLAGERA